MRKKETPFASLTKCLDVATESVVKRNEGAQGFAEELGELKSLFKHADETAVNKIDWKRRYGYLLFRYLEETFMYNRTEGEGIQQCVKRLKSLLDGDFKWWVPKAIDERSDNDYYIKCHPAKPWQQQEKVLMKVTDEIYVRIGVQDPYFYGDIYSDAQIVVCLDRYPQNRHLYLGAKSSTILKELLGPSGFESCFPDLDENFGYKERRDNKWEGEWWHLRDGFSCLASGPYKERNYDTKSALGVARIVAKGIVKHLSHS